MLGVLKGLLEDLMESWHFANLPVGTRIFIGLV